MLVFPDGTMSIKEAAKQEGKRPATLYLAISQGKLRRREFFGRLIVTQEDLELWHAKRGNPGRKSNHLKTFKQLNSRR